MKKSSLILSVIFLFSIGFYQGVSAQDKSKEEKDKELQQLIEEQKKAMVDQKKAQEEAQKEAQKAMEEHQVQMEKAMKDVQDLKNLQIKVESPENMDKVMKIYENGRRNGSYFSYGSGEPFMITPGVDVYGHWGDSEKTNWDFSKSIKESSFSRDYTFDVDNSANTVVMAVNGDCKSGEIRIKITMPNNKVYSDILIDESGNLNWRKSFTISDTENKDKAGAWKFEISASKATGFFRISLQTY